LSALRSLVSRLSKLLGFTEEATRTRELSRLVELLNKAQGEFVGINDSPGSTMVAMSYHLAGQPNFAARSNNTKADDPVTQIFDYSTDSQLADHARSLAYSLGALRPEYFQKGFLVVVELILSIKTYACRAQAIGWTTIALLEEESRGELKVGKEEFRALVDLTRSIPNFEHRVWAIHTGLAPGLSLLRDEPDEWKNGFDALLGLVQPPDSELDSPGTLIALARAALQGPQKHHVACYGALSRAAQSIINHYPGRVFRDPNLETLTAGLEKLGSQCRIERLCLSPDGERYLGGGSNVSRHSRADDQSGGPRRTRRGP
jgi:hypothetical protein